MRIFYYILFGLWYLLSLLPLRVHYFFSDVVLYPLLFHLIGYRRKVVQDNLKGSFPEKSDRELAAIERDFYHFLCDYMVETVKTFSMSKVQMMRRMTFSGLDELVKAMDREQKQFCFVYLGHYCNWEWIASMPYWVPSEYHCAQIYHRLRNPQMDALFLRLRNRYGGECIAMQDTLRRIIEIKRSGQKEIIGFISDQAPKWNSIHHWCDFFHRDTPVFIGTEKIGKQVDALIYYMDIKRIRRGYYHCQLKPITHQVRQIPDFELTDTFTHILEQMISAQPAYWLWSHKRWKRTKEEWIERQKNANEHEKAS